MRGSARSLHGIRRIVMTPPFLMRRGHKLEFAGETTFAPILTLSVASRIAIREKSPTRPWKQLVPMQISGS